MTTTRLSRGLLGAVCLVGLAGGTARAEENYQRVSLTVNALYLLVPVYQLNAELAVHERWGVAVRGGAGRPAIVGDVSDQWIVELGGQGVYYVTGNASRGIQLGVDTRLVSYGGDGWLMGLGDGVAIGPVAGYKRVFGRGITLAVQGGAHVAVTDDSDGRVLPFLMLSLGVSFWPAGSAAPATSTATSGPGQGPPSPAASPFDYHDGLMFGASLGGGSAVIDGCDSCELTPGMAVDASLGWFLGRRFALMIDSAVIMSFFSLTSGLGSFGFGLSSLALQYWPHEDFWLKVGVGVAQMVSMSPNETGSLIPLQGGGGTLAAGYEFHHDRNFAMDVQLRATHGSFEPEDGAFEGVDSFTGVVGVHWY